MNILGVSGSLRKMSFNTSLLRAAVEMAPTGVTIDIFGLEEIPLYNDDVRVAGFPPAVIAWREAIRRADGVLIATPEYNFSFPGVLKNAIDWASRPPDQPCSGKPVGLMGATGGLSGTMRGQYQLRQVLLGVDMLAMTRPEVFVRNAKDKFAASGALTDEETRALVRKFVDALIAWTQRLSSRANP
jgi:chromate reductase